MSRAKTILEICWRNLGKLETQINNLLDLARLSHSKEQYSLEPVDLASLVRTSAENLQAAAAERKVKLDVSRLPEASAPGHGQPRQTGATGGQLAGQRREIQQGER